jgi:hypothetical protein
MPSANPPAFLNYRQYSELLGHHFSSSSPTSTSGTSTPEKFNNFVRALVLSLTNSPFSLRPHSPKPLQSLPSTFKRQSRSKPVRTLPTQQGSSFSSHLYLKRAFLTLSLHPTHPLAPVKRSSRDRDIALERNVNTSERIKRSKYEPTTDN